VGDIEVPMMKIVNLSSAVAAVLIVAAAGPALYLHAQTANEAWSTFLGTNQPDLQPNRIRIEYEEPHSAATRLQVDDAPPPFARDPGDL
jgi:hypothetical protein